ncbi:hypothetical protein [Homoserinimonas sp. OAct 916]|uniref:hypothetical protein n=1 Tax=Homoserinimonas sp. OAct 916 TaxID=2211450 RepID=UPI000DBE97FB|nr:hypothetical protein [Homoserinimonas sp. OAct 916]
METTPNEHASNQQASDERASSDPAINELDDGLLSRVKVIEDQPLPTRAAAYGQVHDELRQRLEGTDRHNG